MSALPPKADILCAVRYFRSSHVTLAAVGQVRKRCIEAIKGSQARNLKSASHHAATLIVPSRLSTITGE